jgi:hypothetical protein
MEYVAKFGWTVLPHPPYSPDLYGLMKDGLRGQHFPDNDPVMAAVRKWIASAVTDFYERSMQAFDHRR